MRFQCASPGPVDLHLLQQTRRVFHCLNSGGENPSRPPLGFHSKQKEQRSNHNEWSNWLLTVTVDAPLETSTATGAAHGAASAHVDPAYVAAGSHVGGLDGGLTVQPSANSVSKT